MSQRIGAFKHLHLQYAMVCIFLVVCISLLVMTLEHAVVQTGVLVILVSVIGLFLISRLPCSLGDNRLQLLGYVWIAKLILTLFLVYFTWMPELGRFGLLDPAFDPIRYYYQAQELVDQDWNPSVIAISYVGILYYFGGLFYLFGHNPINPAFLNAFTTLLATLLLVRVGYEITTHRSAKGWMLGLAMILPEVLYYDVMTSRESVVMMLVTVILLLIGRGGLSVSSNSNTSRLGVGVVVFLSLLGLAVIRTSLIAPIILAIILMALLFKSPVRGVSSRKLTLILLIAATMALPIVAVSLGYDFFSFATMFENVLGTHQQLESEIGFTKNSISQLIIPNNSVQAFIFIWPRLILYIVAPIPTIQFGFSGLLAGSFGDWFTLAVTVSAALNIIFFPWAVASLIYSLRERAVRWKELVFHIPYWSLILSVAAGNQILHERYRLMTTILFWGCVWLGMTTCPNGLIKKVVIVWFLFLGFAGLGFFIYKM